MRKVTGDPSGWAIAIALWALLFVVLGLPAIMFIQFAIDVIRR